MAELEAEIVFHDWVDESGNSGSTFKCIVEGIDTEANEMADKEFTITSDHTKLLRRMYVRWDDCEYGAPAIDPKRPYGNSDVENDIAEILGWDIADDDGALTEYQSETAGRIHKEMETVLQILLSAGQLPDVPALYRNRSEYEVDWIRVR